MTKDLLVAVLAAALGVFVSLRGASREAVAQQTDPENTGSFAADLPSSCVPDGKQRTEFSYTRDTDRLAYITPRLSYVKHTVKIVAEDAADNTATKKWSFKVVQQVRTSNAS